MRIAPLGAALALLQTLQPAEAEAWHRLPPGQHGSGDLEIPAVRGVTIGPIERSDMPGRGYGTPYTEALLDELGRMGVNWISITPFGRVWDLRDPFVQHDFEMPREENRAAIARLVEQAHARGMRALIVPHLWVETTGWRGEIDFPNDEQWLAYQRAYADFVLDWARDAELAGADAFSIGVECKSWSGRFGAFWATFIAEVRRRFLGLLTYSANWDEVENVLFWDQLDLIGVNAFYPLADHDNASDAEYLQGARRAMESLREQAHILDMPVLLVEVGYTTRANAAVEPWLWPDEMTNVKVDEHEQARALDAIFQAFLPEPWIAGLFIWRYYADIDDVSQEAIWGFSPHAKEAERVMARAFGHAWGVEVSEEGD